MALLSETKTFPEARVLDVAGISCHWLRSTPRDVEITCTAHEDITVHRITAVLDRTDGDLSQGCLRDDRSSNWGDLHHGAPRHREVSPQITLLAAPVFLKRGESLKETGQFPPGGGFPIDDYRVADLKLRGWVQRGNSREPYEWQ